MRVYGIVPYLSAAVGLLCRWYWIWPGGNRVSFLFSWVSLQQTMGLPAPLMEGEPTAPQSISFPSSVAAPSTHNPAGCRAASQVWQETINQIKVSSPACMSIRKHFSPLRSRGSHPMPDG